MAAKRLLSVDTAYDPTLLWLKNERASLYQDFNGDTEPVQLEAADNNRATLIEQCTKGQNDPEPYFHFLSFCSHGMAGHVLNKPDSSEPRLLSVDDSDQDLSNIVGRKAVYLFACETARSELPERILNAGATMFVGFSHSPDWKLDRARRLWRDIDHAFLRNLISDRGATGIRQAREIFFQEIERTKRYANPTYKANLGRINEALKGMEIVEA